MEGAASGEVDTQSGDGTETGDHSGTDGSTDGGGMTPAGPAEPAPAEPRVVAVTTAGADIFFPGCFSCNSQNPRSALVAVTDSFVDPAFDDLAIVLTNSSGQCIKVRLLLYRTITPVDGMDCSTMYLTTATAAARDSTLVFVQNAAELGLTGQVRVDETILEGDSATPASCEGCEPTPALGCCQN
ncbi:MAG: hypothetical protein AMXMBFR13_24430 [Phycisphaerae bacterium]